MRLKYCNSFLSLTHVFYTVYYTNPLHCHLHQPTNCFNETDHILHIFLKATITLKAKHVKCNKKTENSVF